MDNIKVDQSLFKIANCTVLYIRLIHSRQTATATIDAR